MVLQEVGSSRLNGVCVYTWLSNLENPKRDAFTMEEEGVDALDSPIHRQGSPPKRQRTDIDVTSSLSITTVPVIPPSVSQSSATKLSGRRPPSPTKVGDRVRRANLEFTKPSFVLGPPSNTAADDEDYQGDLDRIDEVAPLSGVAMPSFVPPTVSDLINTLSEYTNITSSIPADLAQPVRALSQGLETIPPQAFGPSRFPPSVTPHSLLIYAKSIYTAASQNFRAHESESAWYLIARSILSGPVPMTSTVHPPFLTVQESQTILVHAELLPRLGGYPIPSVKMDHLLQFNRGHPNVGRDVLNRLLKAQPGLWLSAFNDAVAGKTFTAGVVEVKGVGGDVDEGLCHNWICSADSASLQTYGRRARLSPSRKAVQASWSTSGFRPI